MKFSNLKKQKNGITLIALVITIIVLLILAGVSIATLTGQNGILTRANESKTKTDLEQAREAMKLVANGWQIEKYKDGAQTLEDYLNERVPNELDNVTKNDDGTFTVEVNGYEGTIDANGELVGELAKNEPPKPLELVNVDTTKTNPNGSLPKGATVVEENGKELNDANEGIVIKDKNNNEWVWIEVPKSEMPTDLTFANDVDYDTLTTKLKEYASPYTEGKKGQGCNWTDEWYDKLGTTYDGENEYSQVKYANSSSNFNTAKEYYGTIYTDKGTTPAESYVDGTTYYAKITEKLNDTDGCGLTYSQYQETYKTMLKSLYTNGGFWIGRYEAGIEGTTGEDISKGRTYPNQPRIDISSSQKAISQKDAIPYNYVYCSEVQKLSNAMSKDTGRTTSLLFGLQWDLTCKFLQVKGGLSEADINSDSQNWGNHSSVQLTIDNGTTAKQYTSSAGTWSKITGEKSASQILLSTGASTKTKKMNIYDFAGNEWEWTLEHTSDANGPCSSRGGSFFRSSSSYPASSRGGEKTTYGADSVSFRPALY